MYACLLTPGVVKQLHRRPGDRQVVSLLIAGDSAGLSRKIQGGNEEQNQVEEALENVGAKNETYHTDYTTHVIVGDLKLVPRNSSTDDPETGKAGRLSPHRWRRPGDRQVVCLLIAGDSAGLSVKENTRWE